MIEHSKATCPPQAWTELVIRVDATDVERAGDIAHMAAPYGIYIEDYSDLEEGAREIAHIDLIDEELLAKDRDVSFVHIYLSPQDHPAEATAFLEERLAAAGIAYEILTRACRNEDWENNWKAYFHPLPMGNKLLIQPVWEALADAGERAVLLLEPGLAFGSGSHATTRLCMEALELYIKPGCDVLDIGCGSGILSIAAILLGAGEVLGVDIDPMAVENARENAARNGCGDRTRFSEGDLLGAAAGQYDVIVSNIVADAILQLCPLVRAYLKPGGVWISAGIIDARASEVLVGFARCGFEVVMEREEEGWCCFGVR